MLSKVYLILKLLILLCDNLVLQIDFQDKDISILDLNDLKTNLEISYNNSISSISQVKNSIANKLIYFEKSLKSLDSLKLKKKSIVFN